MAATQVTLPAAGLKAEFAKNGDATCKKRAIEDVEEEIKVFEARFEAMQRQRTEWEARLRNADSSTPDPSVMEVEERKMIGGWRKWSGEWTPRPIGVL